MTNVLFAPRKTILVLAYSISPKRGSEYAVGWDYVTHMARHHDLIVLYGLAGPHMGDFEEMAGVSVPGVTFVPVKPDWSARMLNKPNRAGRLVFTFYLAYERWHRQAFLTAQEIVSRQKVDLVHYLCPIGYREPGYLWKLDIPYIWGPIGGINLRPTRHFMALEVMEGLKTAVRNTLNWLQFRISRRLRKALRKTDVLIANTAENARLLLHTHGTFAKILPENGITALHAAPSKAPVTEPANTPDYPLQILWVGSIDTRKALDYLVDALSRMTAENWTLNIVGDGPRRPKLEALAEGLGLSGKISWHGQLPRADVARFFSTADVHVLSSLADGSPTVLWEAMSHHIPTIAFDHCGAHDNLCDQCGILLPVGDVAALQRALERLVHNRDEVARLAAGTLECAKNFSWERRVKFWNATYDLALRRFAQRNGT